MVKSIKPDTTRARAKQNKPAAKKAVAKKPAAKKPASISLEKAIPELEREVKRIAELESDPMLRAILTGRIILTADEMADSIEKGFLEGKVIYDSNGAPDPAQSSIAANELPRLLDFIRRSLEKTKVLYLEQHNIEGCPASFDLSYWSKVAHNVGRAKNWGYWCKLRYLTPMEASCLLVELDPDSYANIKTHNTPQVNALGEYVVRLERHAERDNEGKKLSSAKWIEWAQGKGYTVPKKFVDTEALYGSISLSKKSVSAKELESTVREFKTMYEDRCKKNNMRPYPVAATKEQFKDCMVRVMGYGAHITADSLHDGYLKPLKISFKGGNPGNDKANIFDSLFPACEKN